MLREKVEMMVLQIGDHFEKLWEKEAARPSDLRNCVQRAARIVLLNNVRELFILRGNDDHD